jgi:hypothetical protein
MKKKIYYIVRSVNLFPAFKAFSMKQVNEILERNYPESFNVEKYVITKSYNKERMNHVRKVYRYGAVL